MSRMSSLFASVQGTSRRVAPPPGGSPPPPPAPGVPTTFDALYSGGFTLNGTQTLISRGAQTKPTVKSTSLSDVKYTDGAFGTKMFLLTDNAEVTPSTVAYVRNDYAKRQMFSATNVYFLAWAEDGHWHLYNATTMAHISVPGSTNGWLPQMAGDCEATWHPTDDNILWFTDHEGALVYKQLNITTGVVSTAWTFVGRIPANLTGTTRFYMGGEGRPSSDCRYWCFMARDSTANGGNAIGFMTYDRVTDTIIDSVASTLKINWCGMSNSGLYAVFGADGSGRPGGHVIENERALGVNLFYGTRAYPRDALGDSAGLRVLDQSGQHGDMCTDVNGDDVWFSAVYSPYNGMNDGDVYYRRVHDEFTHVYSGMSAYWSGQDGAAMHFSGCAFDRPGWGVASYNSHGTPLNGRDGTIQIFQLTSSSPKIKRMCHHRMDGNDYFATPFATPDRSLTRVLWGTDWNQTGTPYEQFMAGLPSTALD